MESAKNEILAHASLEALVGEKVTLQKRSGRLLGLCPFHEEKTPSFHVFQNRYHCFGCQAHGDAITWVRHFEGVSFLEALAWLAKKFNIQVELGSPERAAHQQQAQRRSQLFRFAMAYFQESLQASPPALAYLESRGFSPASIAQYEFGYAPDVGQGFCRKLQAAGFLPEEIEQASLATRSQGRLYDFFRNRVIIPIRDSMGRVVAFGGRALDANPAKYKNSRYDKGALLFGIDTARQLMRQKGRAIVVEGYLDAIQLWQHGLGETVACQGTALTSSHLSQLSHATRLVYLLFDGDQAGRSAAWGLVEKSLEFQDLQLKVVRLPADADPDSFVRSQGPEALERLFQQAEDLLPAVIQHKMEETGAVTALLEQEVIPWLRRLQSPIQKEFLSAKLAGMTGISVELLRSQIQGESVSASASASPSRDSTPIPSEVHSQGASATLSQLGYEFLGHLFYAGSGELLLEKARIFLEQEWESDACFQSIGLEMLQFLSTGTSPCAQGDTAWAGTYQDEIQALFRRLRQEADAFQCKDREQTLTKLRLLHRRKKITDSLRVLRIEAAFQEKDRESWRQVAQAIINLTQESERIQVEILACSP